VGGGGYACGGGGRGGKCRRPGLGNDKKSNLEKRKKGAAVEEGGTHVLGQHGDKREA